MLDGEFKNVNFKYKEENEEVLYRNIDAKQSFTEPPARYTEASLVKAMEENGVGRPSTYAPTISTIEDRLYIEKEGKYLVPTDLGMVVNKLLEENFKDIHTVKDLAGLDRVVYGRR